MRYVFVLIAFLTFNSLLAQDKPFTDYWKNKQKRSEGKLSASGKEMGLWKYWNEHGVLVQEVEYYYGVPNGTITYFFANGKKENEGQAKQGVKHGPYKAWDYAGNIEVNGFYKNDNRDSIWTYFYPNGKKNKEELFVTDDSIKFLNLYSPTGDTLVRNGNGIYKSWFPGGKVEETGFYKDGMQDSLWITYYSNGKILKKGSYKKGEKIGLWLSWFKEGSRQGEMNYGTGTSKTWFENG